MEIFRRWAEYAFCLGDACGNGLSLCVGQLAKGEAQEGGGKVFFEIFHGDE